MHRYVPKHIWAYFKQKYVFDKTLDFKKKALDASIPCICETYYIIHNLKAE